MHAYTHTNIKVHGGLLKLNDWRKIHEVKGMKYYRE